MSISFNFGNAARITDAVSHALFGTALFDLYGISDSKSGARRLFDTLSDELSTLYTRDRAQELAKILDSSLGSLADTLMMDAAYIYERDPAATGTDEVIFTYPGFFAIFCHRIAHILYSNRAPLAARFISERAHSLSGADIHPGAVIGERFSIDHATGIVIGETAEIGREVAIYHGVTVGAKSVARSVEDRSLRIKRHPTIEDGCTIYAGATVLGGDTVVGRGSVIGAGVRVTRSVFPGMVIK